MNNIERTLKRLSLIIPIFNEEDTVLTLLDRVMSVALPANIQKEIILVDDCSSDQSHERIKEFILNNSQVQGLVLVTNDTNLGKGAAVLSGLQHATGEYVLIQDADLELDPNDYKALLAPVIAGEADVVYGSRFMGKGKHRKQMQSHFLANKVITSFGNLISGLNLTDLQTCYKLIPTPLFKSLELKEKRFAFDPEVTMRLSRKKGLRWKEVPISYTPRLLVEGKKIGYVDGFRALYSLMKYRFFA